MARTDTGRSQDFPISFFPIQNSYIIAAPSLPCSESRALVYRAPRVSNFLSSFKQAILGLLRMVFLLKVYHGVVLTTIGKLLTNGLFYQQ